MEQVEVDIMVQAVTYQYGTLNPGDILRTNAAFAAHLVDDCGAARYRAPAASEPVQSDVQTSAQVAEQATEVKLTKAQQKAADRAARAAEEAKAEQVSAPADPYAHLGTLVAVVSGAADKAVQTSAQPEEKNSTAADTQDAASDN